MTTWYQSAVHQQEVKSSVHCHAQHEFRELGYICPTVCLCLWIPLNSSVDSCSSCRCFSSLLHFINVRLSNWDTLEPQTCRSAGLVKITSAIREEITTSSLSADSRPEVSNISSFLTTLSQSSLLEVLRMSFTEAMWSWCCAVQIKLVSFNTEEKSSSYKLIPELSGCFQERLNVQRFVEIKIQTHELFNIINDSSKRHAENQ